MCAILPLFPGFFRVFSVPVSTPFIHQSDRKNWLYIFFVYAQCSLFHCLCPFLPRYFHFSKAPKNRIGEVLLAQAINEIGTKYFFMSFDYDGVGVETKKLWLFMLKNHKTFEKGTWKWKWAMEGYYQHLELGWSGSKTNLMSCLGLRISMEMSRRFNSKGKRS